MTSQKRLRGLRAADHPAQPLPKQMQVATSSTPSQYNFTTAAQPFVLSSGRKHSREPMLGSNACPPQEAYSKRPFSSLHDVQHLSSQPSWAGFDQRVKNKLFLHIDLSTFDCRSNGDVWICHFSFTVTFPRDRIHSFCRVQKL